MEVKSTDWYHLKDAMKGLEDALRCWICNKVATDPVSYRCSHFVCGICAKDNGSKCPLCSVPSLASEINPDRVIAAVVGCFQNLSSTIHSGRSASVEKSLSHEFIKPASVVCQDKEDTPSITDVAKGVTVTDKKSLTSGGKRNNVNTRTNQGPLKKSLQKNETQYKELASVELKSDEGSLMKPPRGRRTKSVQENETEGTSRGKVRNMTVELGSLGKSSAPFEDVGKRSKVISKKASQPRSRRSSAVSVAFENSKSKHDDTEEFSIECVTTPKKPRRTSNKLPINSPVKATPSKANLNSEVKATPIKAKLNSAVKATPSKTNMPGKELSKRNYKGETPLHVACIKGNVVKVRSLLESKASPNTKDHAGWTPLHEATNHGFTEVVELLLKAGALVDVPGVGNVTPLHEAVSNNQISIVKLLVSYGADIYARSSLGKTPMDLVNSDELKEALVNTKRIDQSSQAETGISKSNSAEQTMVVYGAAGLTEEERNELSSICSKKNIRLLQKFGPDVTHFIVPSNDDNSTCPPSVELLSAILTGVFILSRDWLKIFMNDDNLELDDEIFEIAGVADFQDANAPKLSRLNAQKQLPRLFDGCHFFVTSNAHYNLPNCELSRSDIVTLIRIGGGIVLKRNPDPEAIPTSEQTVPYHAPRSGSLTSTSHFTIYSPGKGEPVMKYNMKHCKTLPVEWFVTCVLNWRLIDP